MSPHDPRGKSPQTGGFAKQRCKACQPLRTFDHDSSRKTNKFAKWTTPSRNAAYIWQIRNTSRPTFSTLRRTAPPSTGNSPASVVPVRASDALPIESAPPPLFCLSLDTFRPCLIETSSAASATPCPCPTSSGGIIAWSHRAGNTSAFVHSTTTPSPHLGSTNGMENGGTSASPVVPVETSSRT